jgi:hypothetical protein
MTFFLASLSNMEETFLYNSIASTLSVAAFSLLMKVRVVLAWYLFLKRFTSLARILFRADL